MGTKALHIRFNEIDGFIKIYDGIRYLVLFDHGWFNKICDRIKYFISKKSGITDSINDNFARIRIESHNSLPIEKILTFHTFNNNKNNYYYNIFLEKGLYKDKSNTEYL